MEALLMHFKVTRMSAPPVKHITARPEHFVEDGIRTLFKGDFDAGSNLVVEIDGKATSDLGGPRKQFFTNFLPNRTKWQLTVSHL